MFLSSFCGSFQPRTLSSTLSCGRNATISQRAIRLVMALLLWLSQPYSLTLSSSSLLYSPSKSSMIKRMMKTSLMRTIATKMEQVHTALMASRELMVSRVSRVSMATKVPMDRITMVKTISTRSPVATSNNRTVVTDYFKLSSSLDINNRLGRSNSWRKEDSTDKPDNMDKLDNKMETVPIYIINTIKISIRHKRRKKKRLMMRS